jgi:hypothetical protein
MAGCWLTDNNFGWNLFFFEPLLSLLDRHKPVFTEELFSRMALGGNINN